MHWAEAVSPAMEATTLAIVRAESAEEQEYEQRLAEIAERRRRIAELQADVAELKRALAGFEVLCYARIGDLLAELRRIERGVLDYTGRLERLHSVESDPADADQEEPGPFAWWDERTAGATGDRTEPPPQRKPPRRLGREDEREVKRLYRDLAKRCHPDYAQTDEERRRREALMQQVNEAFRARDLRTLRALHREVEADDPTFPTRPVRERLAWALGELERLGALLGELKAELAELHGSEAHRLWRRHQAGEPVIETLEDDLEMRLASEGRRLDRLIAAYRRGLDERQQVPVAS